MNIFVISKIPVIAARMVCDKHIVKMPLESAQMLCSVWHRFGKKNSVPYKEAFKKHPCTLWAGNDASNYEWLYYHALTLCLEFTNRYNKIHSCQKVIESIPDHPTYNSNKDILKLSHPKCMPDIYKHDCAVKSYREYYIKDKVAKGIAKWQKLNNMPQWVTEDIKKTLQ